MSKFAKIIGRYSGIIILIVIAFWLGGKCNRRVSPTPAQTVYILDTTQVVSLKEEIRSLHRKLNFLERLFTLEPIPETVRVYRTRYLEKDTITPTDEWFVYLIEATPKGIEVRTTNLTHVALMNFQPAGDCFRLVAAESTVPLVYYWNTVHYGLKIGIDYDFNKLYPFLRGELRYNRLSLSAKISKRISVGIEYQLWGK